MSKQLCDGDIEIIVKLVDGWTGKLTWELLIDAVWKRLKNRYTRQALNRHDRVQAAFAARKKELRTKTPEGKKIASPPELQAALDRIDALEAKTRRLERENKHLLEQFVRWAHNAKSKGLTADFLNRPLPPVNRGATEDRM
ncbi:hypothetical protein KP003_19145 [Geomonas nitrogeniifigens]|uniref:hypothetical protein n=1 Tax=Geomonas diazotrophica TaxID=2843197 RepID=UPI001C2BBFC5|nr:hypothetical protein [Geomonas nitrogeniifigens]QXE86450.1 hypothetical protein KP003_19145 [Geomonas nitrogeniifigens]